MLTIAQTDLRAVPSACTTGNRFRGGATRGLITVAA
jgi:hypothetical protein